MWHSNYAALQRLVTFSSPHFKKCRRTPTFLAQYIMPIFVIQPKIVLSELQNRNRNFFRHNYLFILSQFFCQCHHMSLMDLWSPFPAVAEVQPTSEVGTPMRRSYVVPMRWMVIHEYEVSGRALNLSSTKLPRPWSPWESSPSRKNPHGRIGNRAWDLMILFQMLTNSFGLKRLS
jgi:hypothetical protein